MSRGGARKVRQGSVVDVWVVDPQGGNKKCRPMVIVSRTKEIQNDKPIVLVAISGEFSDPPLSDEILLPFGSSGRLYTGLTKKCAAKCSWRLTAELDDIENVRGHLKSTDLAKIIAAIKKLDEHVED